MEQAQLRGTVETVTFQNMENGFAVLTLCNEEGDLVCVVGPLAGCAPGEALLLTGRYTEHPTYGVQFEAAECSFEMPESETAILKYLSSGVLSGVGPATARNIVKRFGDRSLEVIASTPEQLVSVKGITPEKARSIGGQFLEVYGAREAVAAFSRMGLSATESLAVYRQHGQSALQEVGSNPYLLCSAPLFLPFGRVDEIASRLSIERESRERTRAAILYTLRHNSSNGHTCVPKARLLQTVSEFFGIYPEEVEEEFDLLAGQGEVTVAEYRDSEYAYGTELYGAEMMAALHLRAMLGLALPEPAGLQKQIEGLEIAQGIRYAEEQKKAIQEALCRRVLVITGGPGTGKTTTVNAILALFEQQAERVLLAAPTGRAAKRMSELTGRKATTIHRLLEVDFNRTGGQHRFVRNEKNPLRCDVLVVDEMSMVDAVLFQHLLAALPANARLVMVGDTDQLPSVGPGNVLRGVLDSGVVPAVHLTEIFRQAAKSLIVTNAHRIVVGEAPHKGGREDDFFFLKSYGTPCQKLVCQLVSQRLPASYRFDPAQDIQVLCPGRKGPLGTEVLNERLQQLLNPASPDKPELRFGGRVFRLGDKVMQVKNNYDIPYTRADGEPGTGAFNGDIGFIEEIKPGTNSMTVLCEDRHVYYTGEFLHELETAYAITIHKSQGSEFEAVVIPLSEVPSLLRYRNLLYTGVTRAKQLCILAGEEEVLSAMVENGRRSRRFSCFADMLCDEALV